MSKSFATSNVHAWVSEPLSADVVASLNRLAQADDVRHVAVMPDVHLSSDVCIGTVVATGELIYPAAIGGDIGCGMAAVRFDVGAELLLSEQAAALVLRALYQQVPTNRHSGVTMPAGIPECLARVPLSNLRLERLKQREARVQYGTLGRGNHFLELQADATDQLWLMVHSGSRAMGQAITAHHLARASEGQNGLKYYEADSTAGKAYLDDVAWAQRYAEQNRLAMVGQVARLMQGQFAVETDWPSLIHGHHNHVRREQHFGEHLWVHRKGAQSAREGEPGIIPGSMGTASFHVAGRGCGAALTSSSHGAGRRLSRTEARRSISARQLFRQLESVWFDQRFAAVLRDEAPGAYKDIYAVMRAQKGLTRITRELRPLLSYKGR